MGRLDGKVAIVTGAARGTGETTARLFASEGARVVVADVLEDLGKSVAEDLGESALFARLDVTDADQWDAAVAAATERFGPPTVLVNNAAILEVRALPETTPEKFTDVLHVNLLGPFLGIRAVFEAMKGAGGGSIVNVSSIDGLESHNGLSAYASSKWGVRGLTKTAALELGRYAIRVNAVCPGPGSSDMIRPFVDDAIRRFKESGEKAPRMGPSVFHRRGEMLDVARAILFLASDEASFVNGADLAVDGGLTAGKLQPGAPSA